MQRRRFLGNTGLAAGFALASGSALAQATPTVKWRMSTSWPKSLDAIYGSAEEFCKRVSELTAGRFEIRSFAGGEIVPPAQNMDAVSNGTIECNHVLASAFVGKNSALAFDTGLPFGLNSRQHNAWTQYGGGMAALRPLYKKYNIVNFVIGNVGVQMGGFFRKEIKSVEDLKGMLITARDIVQRLPGIDETHLRHELAGNLCRCTGYTGIVRAVSSVARADPECTALAAAPRPAAPCGNFVTFEARDAGETGGESAQRRGEDVVAHAAGGTGGAPQIVESLIVRGCDADRLWVLLADVSAAASCLPGASIERFDGRELAGTVRISFGPISAVFAGVGAVERDEAARTTVIRGSGRDPLSKTEAQATIRYGIAAAEAVPGATRLTIGMDYVVQGPLAQFSRSELVRSLVAQIVREFGRNLERLVAGETVAAQAPARLGVAGLLWRWLKDRFAALLGRQ